MKKSCSDLKVKKTFVRNCEQKIREPLQPRVVRDTEVKATCSMLNRGISSTSQKENDLNHPTLCSSEVLANYMTDVKKSLPPPLSAEDLNEDKDKISAKVTKKLNFHLTDKIFNNLIELNANVEDLKTRRDKKSSGRATNTKRDQEPNIEDFFQDDAEIDSPPDMPVIRPKFRPLRRVEDGQLHKLVMAFDVL